MTLKEKLLFHQIHPLKLGVDISTSLMTTYLAWQHNIAWFLTLFLVPSVVATFLLVKFADLQRLKNCPFGKYVEKHMTPAMQAVRGAGQVLMWCGAWFHLPTFIGIGILCILGAWLSGLFWKRAESN